MTERDPLDALLREWKSPEPASELDERVVNAYRAAFRGVEDATPMWQRFWKMRVSIPVPLLLAAAAIVALIFWFRPAHAPSVPPNTANLVTRLHATGFEPLPNGEVHVIWVKETRQ